MMVGPIPKMGPSEQPELWKFQNHDCAHRVHYS
jgi:hypothetical protein